MNRKTPLDQILFDKTALANTAPPEDQEKIKNYIQSLNLQLGLLLTPIGRLTWINGRIIDIVKNPDDELLAIIKQKDPDAKPDRNGEIGLIGLQISKAQFPNEPQNDDRWNLDFDSWIKDLNIDRQDNDPHGFLDDYLKMILIRNWLLRACENGRFKITGWSDDSGPLYQITEKGIKDRENNG